MHVRSLPMHEPRLASEESPQGVPSTLSKDVAAGRESSEGRRLLVFDLERHLAVDRAGGNILNLMRGNGGLEIELVGRRRNAVAEIRFHNDRGALRELQLLLALFVSNADADPARSVTAVLCDAEHARVVRVGVNERKRGENCAALNDGAVRQFDREALSFGRVVIAALQRRGIDVAELDGNLLALGGKRTGRLHNAAGEIDPTAVIGGKGRKRGHKKRGGEDELTHS